MVKSIYYRDWAKSGNDMRKVSGAYIQTATFSMQGLMTLDLAVTVVQLSFRHAAHAIYIFCTLRSSSKDPKGVRPRIDLQRFALQSQGTSSWIHLNALMISDDLCAQGHNTFLHAASVRCGVAGNAAVSAMAPPWRCRGGRFLRWFRLGAWLWGLSLDHLSDCFR